MERNLSIINMLLIDVFNDILVIEQNVLRKGAFSDVSVTEVHTIEAIGMYNQKSMSEVAKILHITVGTLTVAINRLVKKGYVLRSQCETDRRFVNIKLAKKGRLLYRVHEQFHRGMVSSTVSGLSDTEIRVLAVSLEKLSGFLASKYFLTKGEKR